MADRALLTAENLSRITAKLIAAFRAKDSVTLSGVLRLMPGHPKSQGPARDFASLIKEFHPDRLRSLLERSDLKSPNVPPLPPLAEVLSYLDKVRIPEGLRPARHASSSGARNSSVPAEEDSFETEEETGYDESDFDASGAEETEESDLHEDPEEPEAERDFVSAVKLKEYGSLDVTYTASVLRSMEGAIDLSDYEIDSLSGVENCIGLVSLNLSDNLISDLRPLEGLTALEELFLSANQIASVEALAGLLNLRVLDLSYNPLEDISALLELPRLELLNLVGVPTSKKQKEALSARGVLVVD